MRIVIDLQGAQSESRFRGIGRYSLALALGLARNADPGRHELWLVLNGALGDSIADLRAAFDGLIPQQRIRVFDVAGPVAEHDTGNGGRARAAELVREAAIAALRPDAVLVTSLFEGYVDDAVTSVGSYAGAERTAVILYDLIPHLNPARYLGSPAQRAHYERKIASLRRAGLVLAISDYSRREGIDALGFDAARVVSISTAVDACFRPAPPDAAALAALRARFGIVRELVMYAPGGFDARKNIDGLIQAYALLPAALRGGHQLLVASKIGEQDRAALLDCARRAGLAPDELILTGYVSDDTLIALYRAAALFVFPSLHEGFGLPALEAMACGAPVIGADNTSIPEVIGSADALFDAGSPQAIADKIAAVLGDPARLQALREHGARQAARFSWDASAQKALAALEAHAERLAAAAAAAPAARPKRRLAFVSPLPPERTGIADYALEILPALTAHFDIELILAQSRCTLPPALAHLPQRSVDWFRQNAGHYDQVMYQFGNSPFHSHMFPLLAEHPGVVVLHDFFLSGVVSYDQLSGAVPGAWAEALFHSHGYAALLAGQAPDGVEQAKDSYPCNLAVLENATRVIVHSEYSRTLARHWYHPQAGGDWSVVPHARALAQRHDRAAARAALGIAADAFVVCSFGFIAPTKLTQELVRAWTASALHADRDCELVLVGANHGGGYGAELSALIEAADAGGRIRIAGWTDDPVYHLYLQAADAGVQLRSTSRGETSGAVLYCMSYGVPTIVNANGSLAELPDDAVWMLDDQFSQAALVDALETLRRDPARRAALGQAGRALLARDYSPERCAALYAEAADLAWAEQASSPRALAPALAALPQLPTDDAYLQQLAATMARLPDLLAPRQLLVDVTAIARHDLKTGIERVVRTQLLELLRRPRPGWRVEPVYLSDEGGHWHYRYARRYAFGLLGIEAAHASDPVADAGAGDVFYSGDSSPAAMMAAAAQGLYGHWRARGISVNFAVYDLLPVLHPEFFPAGADAGHAAWLAVAAANADRLISISDAVRQDLRAWLAQHPVPSGRVPALEVLHLGADIDGALAAKAVPQPSEAAPAVPGADDAPTFLMVGTIEPRKGHLQALDAFEQLWRDGVAVNLVIVGHEGWTPLAQHERRTIPQIVRRLQQHPQLGRRLFWLKGIDDAQLLQVYQSSDCLLFASEGEGYGLPLIEAARYGLPVLARDLPVFREVAQQHAHYFSGMDGAALAAALRDWLDLQRAGRAPASTGMRWMSWEQNAAALLALLAAPQA
ncbi:glycosyltransferase [Duganella sp. Dugasp56]|uniref:glycosyltransferase n=1 Tax=Duganella sp. Dugasp56 TaxID=3243046 RepID=UPI0039B0C46D